ncbi:MAG: hypothetical protein J7K04_01455 [Spirochaetales bacterium]|nr:hypothetical protein [Spirochaetales bacterium]RKX82219.1 MAG: hypothetical protein DRP57_10320 [Spirochaetota bacterium]
MSIIKSAYEIAMENTKNVSGDKESLQASKFKTEGKKIVSQYLDDSVENIKDELKKYKDKELKWVKEGVLEALLSNMVLPANDFSLEKTKKVGEGFFSILKDAKKLGMMLNELEHFFKEYLEERERLTEAVKQQFMPKLRQKEEELSKQLGAPIKIDPASDPEYTAFLRQNLSKLEGKYSEVLKRVKDEIRSIYSNK